MNAFDKVLQAIFGTIGGWTPGSTSSEFRVSIFTVIAASILLALGKIDSNIWLAANGLVSLGYGVSRGLAKK